MQRPVQGQTIHEKTIQGQTSQEQTAIEIARARQQRLCHADDKNAQARRAADLDRRMRAAGIDPNGEPPEDMDAFRYQLARCICMFINDWHGCPLRLCQRMRGCMAPESTCANHAGDPPMTREEWDRARVDIRRELDAMIEEAGGRDAWEAAASADRSHQKL